MEEGETQVKGGDRREGSGRRGGRGPSRRRERRWGRAQGPVTFSTGREGSEQAGTVLPLGQPAGAGLLLLRSQWGNRGSGSPEAGDGPSVPVPAGSGLGLPQAPRREWSPCSRPLTPPRRSRGLALALARSRQSVRLPPPVPGPGPPLSPLPPLPLPHSLSISPTNLYSVSVSQKEKVSGRTNCLKATQLF